MPEATGLPVALSAKMNELGLLQVACVSADPRVKQSWPLEFNLRRRSRTRRLPARATSQNPGVEEARLEAARARISSLFSRSLDKRDKLSATNLLKSLEQILGTPKANWNWVSHSRALDRPSHEQIDRRQESIEHEETWLILAGFLSPSRLWRRRRRSRGSINCGRFRPMASPIPASASNCSSISSGGASREGCSRERQETILAPELPKLTPGKARLPSSSASPDHSKESPRNQNRSDR